MIINTQDSIPTDDLLAVLRPSATSNGTLVGIADDQRFSIPQNCSGNALASVHANRRLLISCSEFRRRPILPNFLSTRIVSVSLDLSALPRIRYPKDLFQAVCERLDKHAIPLPSTLVASTNRAVVIWAVDEAFDFGDLSDLYHTESELIKILKEFGAFPALGSASRFIPLFGTSKSLSQPVAIVANGAIKSRVKRRLVNAATANLSLGSAASITRNCEVLGELGSLLFSRSITVAQYPEYNWIWIAAYAAAAHPFIELTETGEIARSVAESLTNNSWSAIGNHPMRFISDSYDGYIRLLLRNLKEGQIKLGGSYYEVKEEDWIRIAATCLKVTSKEIEQLQLSYLRPQGSNTHPTLRHLHRTLPVLGSADIAPYELAQSAA